MLDPPLSHEAEKTPFVDLPVTLVLLVFIQDVLRWGKHRQVHIIHATDCPEEVGKILLLRKPRQLGDVVEAHVDETVGAGCPERLEELLGSLLRKSNRENLHCATCLASCGSGFPVKATRSCCRQQASSISSDRDRNKSSSAHVQRSNRRLIASEWDSVL